MPSCRVDGLEAISCQNEMICIKNMFRMKNKPFRRTKMERCISIFLLLLWLRKHYSNFQLLKTHLKIKRYENNARKCCDSQKCSVFHMMMAEYERQ